MRFSAAAALALATSFLLASCGKDTTPTPVTTLSERLETTRAVYHLPAIAAATLTIDGVSDIGAVGVRRLGAATPVTVNDRYHLGSNVKAMTADLLAMEVEAGHLAWGRPLAEIFPEMASAMRPEYRDVRVDALLQHRAGIRTFTDVDTFLSAPHFPGTLVERRRAFAGWLLEQAPENPVGTYAYSNGGYALAGAIFDRVAAISWDDAIQTRLWAPLGITTGGFGWPAANGASQPWGHVDRKENGTVTPHDPDHDEQFPDEFRSAGDAFMSIGDDAKFARLHLRGLTGHPELLSAASFAKLHEANGPYALGWGVGSLGGTTVLGHLGSAGTFTAFILLVPA